MVSILTLGMHMNVEAILIGWTNNTVLIMTDRTNTNSTMIDLAQQLSNGTDSKKFAVLGQLDNGINSDIHDFAEMILKNFTFAKRQIRDNQLNGKKTNSICMLVQTKGVSI